MKKSLKIILCFVSNLEKHLKSYQYQDLFFEIRHIRTKSVCFLFRLNLDFDFFIKPWRNRPCIWTVPLERVDLDCNFWGSLRFNLTTVGEIWCLSSDALYSFSLRIVQLHNVNNLFQNKPCFSSVCSKSFKPFNWYANFRLFHFNGK